MVTSGSRCRFAYGPADAIATHYLLLQKIQIGFTFLVPAHPGVPDKIQEGHKMIVFYKAIGYASQHIWCHIDAKPGYIGRVVPGRASGVKMVGMAGLGHQLVTMGWQSIWIVDASACVIFILLQKIQKMVTKK